MEYKEIQDLLKLVNKTTLSEVAIEKDGFKLKIKRESGDSQIVYAAPAPPPVAAAPVMAPPVEAAPQPAAPASPPPAAAPAELPKATENENIVVFKSPMIGTFYRSSSPENPSFVNVGDSVKKGQVICIIEAMKLFNEIESEIEGKIVKILVENAQPVEYDQELFLIDTSA